MKKTSNPFIKDFTSKLEITKNPIFLIQNEIKQLESFTSSGDNPSKFPNSITGKYDNSTNSVFDGRTLGSKKKFNKLFYEYNAFDKIEIEEYSLEPNKYKQTVIEFSEYYSWLKSELNKYESKKVEKTTVTHKQKLLILHYLGLNISDNDNNKLAKLLSNSLGLGYDNTRKWLPLLSYNNKEVRTESNLKAVKLLFETAGLQSIAEKIEQDIENIK
jgi:hypothetical protein